MLKIYNFIYYNSVSTTVLYERILARGWLLHHERHFMVLWALVLDNSFISFLAIANTHGKTPCNV